MAGERFFLEPAGGGILEHSDSLAGRPETQAFSIPRRLIATGGGAVRVGLARRVVSLRRQRSVTTIFIAAALLAVPDTARAATEPLSLAPEYGANYSLKDGLLEIRRGRGWLRTRKVFLDFQLAFEFKTMEPETDAGLLVRTWTGRGRWPRRGYRLKLPTDPNGDPARMFVGRKERVVVVERGRLALRSIDAWQSVSIRGEGRRIRVTLNGTLAAVFEIESLGGFILFDTGKGRVHVRNVQITEIEHRLEEPPDVVTLAALHDAGGRAPELLHEVPPVYTPEAMQGAVQGIVMLDVVVMQNGSVGPVRITRSLNRNLDLSAMAAVKGWRFSPGMLDGRAVPVMVQIELTFTLR